jgi:hypothetical protein
MKMGYLEACQFAYSETRRTGVKHWPVKTFYYTTLVGAEKHNICWTVSISPK